MIFTLLLTETSGTLPQQHIVTCQKTQSFSSTAMRTSDHAQPYLSSGCGSSSNFHIPND